MEIVSVKTEPLSEEVKAYLKKWMEHSKFTPERPLTEFKKDLYVFSGTGRHYNLLHHRKARVRAKNRGRAMKGKLPGVKAYKFTGCVPTEVKVDNPVCCEGILDCISITQDMRYEGIVHGA